jgi:hypothetical protein
VALEASSTKVPIMCMGVLGVSKERKAESSPDRDTRAFMRGRSSGAPPPGSTSMRVRSQARLPWPAAERGPAQAASLEGGASLSRSPLPPKSS